MRTKSTISKMLIALLCMSTLQATAAVIEVKPTDPSWGTGDGNSFISDAAPRSGNGSLELRGDRTRYFGLGNPFDMNSNIGLLNDLVDFSFEWAIDANSLSNLGPDYTPALRLHIFDGTQRSELIWEGAYNALGSTDRDTWYNTSFSDNFWQFVSGVGVTEIYDRTITDWQNIYSGSAYISAISVGVGSSAGTDYIAYADNVTLQFANQESRTFNFELDQVEVPNAGAFSIFLLGAVLLAARSVRR